MFECKVMLQIELHKKYKLKMNGEQLKVLTQLLEVYLKTMSHESLESVAISSLLIKLYKRLMGRAYHMGFRVSGSISITLNVFDGAALLYVIRQVNYDQLGPLERSVVYMINDTVRIGL